MSHSLIDTLETAQAQTWWLPESATLYEGENYCLYRLNDRYEIVRFHPPEGGAEQLLHEVLKIVDGAPARFVFFPHRHQREVKEAILRAGFQEENRYEARVIGVESMRPESPPYIEVRRATTLEEMRTIYGIRRQIFGSATPEPEENLRRYLAEANAEPPRVRQFYAIDQRSGETISQAGMSIFTDLNFSFLFAGGTLATARGRGAYTALVNARVAYAKSIGLKHVGLFAKEDSSSPILARQGFTSHGEMYQWCLSC